MSHTPEALLEYTKAAIDLETDLATQKLVLDQCCAEIQQRKPELELEDLPYAPEYRVEEFPSYRRGSLLLGAGSLIFILFVRSLGSLILAIIICSPLLLPGLFSIINTRKTIKQREQKYATYQNNLACIQQRNQQRQEAYDTAIRQCNESIHSLLTTAQPRIDETNALLEKLYDKNIIYRKYCNLPALTSIYEYFVTGRCSELTGPHGAYNLYEDELRKDTVISQLNTVIENLEQIKHNQYMLYQQVKSINENTQIITSELQQIKGYTVQIAQLTALNAYYAKLTERNTRITMYHHL